MHESEASQGVMGLGCNAGRVKNKQAQGDATDHMVDSFSNIGRFKKNNEFRLF